MKSSSFLFRPFDSLYDFQSYHLEQLKNLLDFNQKETNVPFVFESSDSGKGRKYTLFNMCGELDIRNIDVFCDNEKFDTWHNFLKSNFVEVKNNKISSNIINIVLFEDTNDLESFDEFVESREKDTLFVFDNLEKYFEKCNTDLLEYIFTKSFNNSFKKFKVMFFDKKSIVFNNKFSNFFEFFFNINCEEYFFNNDNIDHFPEKYIVLSNEINYNYMFCDEEDGSEFVIDQIEDENILKENIQNILEYYIINLTKYNSVNINYIFDVEHFIENIRNIKSKYYEGNNDIVLNIINIHSTNLLNLLVCEINKLLDTYDSLKDLYNTFIDVNQ